MHTYAPKRLKSLVLRVDKNGRSHTFVISNFTEILTIKIWLASISATHARYQRTLAMREASVAVAGLAVGIGIGWYWKHTCCRQTEERRRQHKLATAAATPPTPLPAATAVVAAAEAAPVPAAAEAEAVADAEALVEQTEAVLNTLKRYTPVTVDGMDPALHYLPPHIPRPVKHRATTNFVLMSAY